MKTKISIFWTICSFLFGTLFGSGALWQWKQIGLEKDRIELEKIRNSIPLREKITETLLKIIELNNEYYGFIENNIEDKSKILEFKSNFMILEDDIIAYEKKLSTIENRKIRKFIYPRPLAPVPVKGVQAKISE